MLKEAGKPPLEPPWTELWRPGEWAMDGPFSLAVTGSRVEATRLDQVRSGSARRAGPVGRVSFPRFFARAKKRGRPHAISVHRRTGRLAGETTQASLETHSKITEGLITSVLSLVL